MSVQDTRTILRNLSKTFHADQRAVEAEKDKAYKKLVADSKKAMKKPVVAPVVAPAVRKLPTRPKKVVVEPKKGDLSEFYCDIFSHENVRLQHDGKGGFYCGDCEEEVFDNAYDDEWDD